MHLIFNAIHNHTKTEVGSVDFTLRIGETRGFLSTVLLSVFCALPCNPKTFAPVSVVRTFYVPTTNGATTSRYVTPYILRLLCVRWNAPVPPAWICIRLRVRRYVYLNRTRPTTTNQCRNGFVHDLYCCLGIIRIKNNEIYCWIVRACTITS